jgi:DNA processing protein
MMNRRVITQKSDEWPSVLSELSGDSAPRRLFVEGQPLRAGTTAVAVVGTRRATSAGIEAASEISRGLAQAGFAVVSGLAVGVDAAAHKAALAAGGYTVAVLGTGLDRHYPERNAALRTEIGRKGTVVTEYPEGTPPHKSHFPARNRIIVGLCEGVVVVEGGYRSGALITARIALDENKTVWAVPGSIRNAMSAGPNELIRRGNAALVTEVEHIFEELSPSLVWKDKHQKATPGPMLSQEERSVLFVLDDVGLSPDRVARRSGKSLGQVALCLSKLEVRGLVIRRVTGYEITGTGAKVRAALA